MKKSLNYINKLKDTMTKEKDFEEYRRKTLEEFEKYKDKRIKKQRSLMPKNK